MFDGRSTIDTDFYNLNRSARFKRSSWRSLFRAVSRRKWAVAFCVLAGWVGAGVYLFLTPAVRETTASVYVEAANPDSDDTGGLVDLQPTVMRSASVAALAVARPEIATLPLLAGQKDPVGFVETRLMVSGGGKQGVFDLSMTSTRPGDAQALLNAVVASYIEFETAQQKQSVDQLESTLRDERRKTSSDLATAQQRLSDLVKSQGESNPTVSAQEQAALQRAQAAAALAQAREQTTDARAAYQRGLDYFGGEDALKAAAAGMGTVTLSEADLDALVSQLQQYQQTPPANQAQRHELAEMKGEYAAAVSQRYDQALQKEDELQTKFGQMEKEAGDAEVSDEDYTQLQSQTEQLIALDSQLSDRLNHWDETQENQVSIKPLAPAQTSADVIWPKPLPVGGVATVLGLLMGLGLARGLDLVRIRLQDDEDACDCADAPLLGRMKGMPWELTTMSLRGQCVLLRPSDPASYAIEDIGMELEKILVGNFYRTVLITSTAKAMGKSVLASNLAIALAQSGQRTTLVDANYSRPSVNETFGIEDQVGLSQAIEGPMEVREALHVTAMENLEILSSGRADANWSELFNQPEFDGVLNQLTERCDRVIIDGTSVNFDETLIVSAYCDATVLVVDPRKGRRKDVRTAAERLNRVGAKLVGIVLNDPPPARKTVAPRVVRQDEGIFRALTQPVVRNLDLQVTAEDLDSHAAPVDAVMKSVGETEEMRVPDAHPAEAQGQSAAPDQGNKVTGRDEKKGAGNESEEVDVWGLKIEYFD